MISRYIKHDIAYKGSGIVKGGDFQHYRLKELQRFNYPVSRLHIVELRFWQYHVSSCCS